MSIAPIVHTVVVRAPPARAFELFLSHMAKWWPKGNTIGKAPHVDIILEPHVGGEWFERDASGNEVQWGKVLEWEPPSRVLLLWQVNIDSGHDPRLRTEIELTFAATDDGGTLVRLEHRKLESYGATGPHHIKRLDQGWPGMLAKFAVYVSEQG